MPGFRTLSLLITLFLACPTLLTATTYYLHPQGDDANTGLGKSKRKAFATVQRALDALAGGDVLILAPGDYLLPDVARLRDRSGTAERPTTIIAQKPWRTNLIIENKKGGLWIHDSHHVLVEGLRIRHAYPDDPEKNWATGLQAFDSDYVTFRNNYVQDCGCGGISFREGDYATIIYNVVRGNARHSPWNCSGISVYQPEQLDDKPGFHIQILANLAYNNECDIPFNVGQHHHDTPTDGNGIILDDFQNSQRTGYPPYLAETLVTANHVYNNGGAGIKAYEVDRATITSNVVFLNLRVLNKYPKVPGEISIAWCHGTFEVEKNVTLSRPNVAAYSFEFVGDAPEYQLLTSENAFYGPVKIDAPEADLTQISITALKASWVQMDKAWKNLAWMIEEDHGRPRDLRLAFPFSYLPNEHR